MSGNFIDDDAARERRVNHHRNVAVVGLRNAANEVLLIRTVRLPTRWQPVGGGMLATEADPAETVIREAAEEVGVRLRQEDLRKVLEAPYDFGVGTVYFYEALLADPASLTVDDRQILESRWCSLQDARRMPMFDATRAYIEASAREQ